MGKPDQTLSAFIPFPKGGLNLVSSPLDYEIDEARTLTNYVVQPWGIRERGQFTANSFTGTAIGAHVLLYTNLPYALQIFSNDVIKFYKFSDGSTNTITFGHSIGGENVKHVPCIFNGYIFVGTFANNRGLSYQISLGGGGAATQLSVAFTGNSGSLWAPFSYKNRLYFVEAGTTRVWYGDVNAIAGALQSFDFGTLIVDGSTILFACSWGYNQGISNEELFVVVTTTGQVIIYAGDNPLANNWQILTRSRIPIPTGVNGYYKAGQDVYIETNRGVVSLQKFFAGAQTVNDDYYLLSNKLGPIAMSGAAYPFISSIDPFIFFWYRDSFSAWSLYVLNFELGAWSYLTLDESIANKTVLGTINDPASGLIYVMTSGQVFTYDPDQTDEIPCSWQTPYFTMQPKGQAAFQKTAKFMRVIAGSHSGTNLVVSSCGIQTDFLDSTGDTTIDTLSTAPAADYVIQELTVGAIGRYFSYAFGKTVDSSTQLEPNEIVGFDAFYEVGGIM